MLRLMMYSWALTVTLPGRRVAIIARSSGGKLQQMGDVMESAGAGLPGYCGMVSL